jgi:hypothetical protein
MYYNIYEERREEIRWDVSVNVFVKCLNVSQTYKYTYKYKRIIKEKRK